MTQQTINEDDIIERLEAGERTIEELKGSLESTLLLLGDLTDRYTSLMDRYEAKSDANQVMVKSIVDLIQLDTAEISGMFAVGLATQGKLEKLVGDAQKKATAAVRKDINKWKKTWKVVDDKALPPALFDKLMGDIKQSIKEGDLFEGPSAAQVAEYLDTSDIATHIDVEDVAYHVSEGEVADNLNMEYVAEYISDKSVAQHIDVSEVALHIDVSDLSNHLVDMLEEDTLLANFIKGMVADEIAEVKVDGKGN